MSTSIDSNVEGEIPLMSSTGTPLIISRAGTDPKKSLESCITYPLAVSLTPATYLTIISEIEV
jgi:hypothetical protein